MNTPAHLKYAKTHEWLRSEDDGSVTIGISDFAQHELGDVVYLELPAEGASLTANEAFGTVESVKAVSDIIAPVSGEVVKVNANLVDAPDTINADPYASWMLVVKPSNPSEAGALMDATAYEAFTADH